MEETTKCERDTSEHRAPPPRTLGRSGLWTEWGVWEGTEMATGRGSAGSLVHTPQHQACNGSHVGGLLLKKWAKPRAQGH